MHYRVALSQDDNDTFLVTCPELPMVVTFGADRAAALHHATDAIETALASMINDGEVIPVPQYPADIPGDFVYLSSQTALKIQLYVTLRDQGLRRADLASRLGWSSEEVGRLLDVDEVVRLDDFDAAFGALGKRVRTEAVAA